MGLEAAGMMRSFLQPFLRYKDLMAFSSVHRSLVFTILLKARNCLYDNSYLQQDVIEDLGIYIVSFDRPGYGESDPNPNRTVKSMAMDIEELADHLGLGPKFYVVGFSMGGQSIWSCLKYIPHR